MCYAIKTSLEAQLSRANRKGDLQAIKENKEKLVPLTDFLIYCDRSPHICERIPLAFVSSVIH